MTVRIPIKIENTKLASVFKMNSANICRTCLSESSDLRSIFKLGVIAGKTTTLSRVLMEFAKITINDEDNFPDKMCYGCVIQASQSFAFLQTCLESDRYLREDLENMKSRINLLSTNLQNSDPDEPSCAEAETQTVYYLNEVHLGENDDNVKVQLEQVDIKIIKHEGDCNEINSNTEEDNMSTIIVREDQQDENENMPEVYIQEDALETEILEEIETEQNADDEHLVSEEYYENEDQNQSQSDLNLSKDSEELLHPTIEQVREINSNPAPIARSLLVNNGTKMVKSYKKVRKQKMFPEIISVPGPPYVCTICQKQLSTKSSFKYHMQLHSDATPYLCNECGEGFKTRNAYEGHMTTHDANNPHKCIVCGKVYRQANSLRTHMLTHTGEKPFLCGICGKGMTQKSGFKKHMLVHSGEMPFQCEICNKKFRYSSNLIAHKKTHIEERDLYICQVCTKNFPSLKELKLHVNTHNQKFLNQKGSNKIQTETISKFPCPFCGKYCYKPEKLKIHINTFHNEEQETEEENFEKATETILDTITIE